MSENESRRLIEAVVATEPKRGGGPDRPLVSIVVRTKDRPSLLEQALQSVMAQTYRPLEVILVNDGGKQPPPARVLASPNDVPLRLVHLAESKGRAEAGNRGLHEARGAYVGFLDDDDRFLPDHVALLTACLRTGGYRVAYTDADLCQSRFNPDTGRFEIQESRLFTSREFSVTELLFENFIPLMCLLFDREVLLDAGGFDPTFHLYEDWDLLVRVAAMQPFYHIRRTTAQYVQWSQDLQVAQTATTRDLQAHYRDALFAKHQARFTPAVLRHMLGFRKECEQSRANLESVRARLVSLESEMATLSSALRVADTTREAAQIREGALLAQLNQLSAEGESLRAQNGDLADSLRKAHARMVSVEAETASLSEALSLTKAAGEAAQGRECSLLVQLDRLSAESESLRTQNADLAGKVQTLLSALQWHEAGLKALEGTLAWTLIARYRNLRDRIFPEGTRRWRAYVVVKDRVKYLVRNRASGAAHVLETTSRSTRARRERTARRWAGSASRRFALYTSTLGNYFFDEIRDLLAAGLEQSGFSVRVANEKEGFVADADWHVVIAPHEFYYLGHGERLRDTTLKDSRLILVNTEQQSTEWFSRASQMFARAARVWDINYESSQILCRMGIGCDYLPLGYVPGFELFDEVRELPQHYGTCFLEPRIRARSYFGEPLTSRPIDVLFIGNLTERRERFFAQAASGLSRYQCYFSFSDGSSPLMPGVSTYMDTQTAIGLAQRSKVVLNIHQAADRYFEWHRMILHGIWQQALVITELSGSAPPFVAGHDYIESALEEIPERVEYFLASPEGQREGQTIVDQGYETLVSKCRLQESLEALIVQL